MMMALVPPHPRRRVLVLALVFALVVITTVSSVPPTTNAQDGPPASARLNGLRHIYQTWNNCSGANLTMALSYYGWGYDQDVARRWLKPDNEDKNVSPGEMAGFVNQQTDLPNIRALWRFGGTLELLKKFIAAGFPVIAESGFDVDDLGWMGHYETVVAYDDTSQTVWVYDSYLGLGDGLGETHSYTDFDSWWRHFNRAFVVLFPTDREQDVRDILGAYVDPAYAAQVALATARQEAVNNPVDSWAWFNAGTSAAKLGNYFDAAIYFDEAFRQGLPYRLMWYMFAPYEAYFYTGRFQDVLTLADNTASTTEYVEETFYWRGMAYAALGRFDEAVAQFDAALAFNPNFIDAQGAKDVVLNGTFSAPAPAQ
ncbi:MAG: tetratricopeptide repeat protein [Anaerolineae bacterium]|nr:tetratricopeptide repeat protein [Anaerolineae bacterium]